MIKKIINNIKDEYKLYSLQKEIETTYKNNTKLRKSKYSMRIKEEVKNTIYKAETYHDILKIYQKKGEFTLGNIPISYKGKELYKDLIYIIGKRINDYSGDILYKRELYKPTIFEILNKSESISMNLDKEDINSILSILLNSENTDKLSCVLDLTYYSYLIKNKELFKSILKSIKENKNKVYYQNLSILIDCYIKNNTKFLEHYINSIISINNKKLSIKQGIKLLNLTEILFKKQNYDLINNYGFIVITDYIMNSIIDDNDEKLINFMINLLEIKSYLKIEHITKQKNIFYCIINLYSEDEERNKLLFRIVDEILSKELNLNIFNYLLKKLETIKNNKSLILLLDTFSLMEEYSNEQSIINTINSIENNNEMSKKLVISLDK